MVVFAIILNFSSLLELSASEIEEVLVVATRGSSNANDVSNSVSVVSKERLQEIQPTIITDALKGAPGVFIQQTTPGQGTAIVRGLKGSEILHLVDGFRLNNALFRNAPNQYLALVDPWMLERSEVVRGPFSTLYGSDAMGGVVHLISQRPQYDAKNIESSFKAKAGFDTTTSGHTYHARYQVGHSNLSSGLSLSFNDQGDLRSADGRRQSPSAYRSRAGSFFVNTIDNSGRNWDLSLQYLEQPETPRYDELVAGFGQTEAASKLFLFKPNSRLFTQLIHRSSGYGKWLSDLEMHFGYQKIRDGRLTQDTGSDNIRIEDNRSDLFGLSIQGETVQLGRHQLTYGVDVYYDEVSSSRSQVSEASGEQETISSRFPDGSKLHTADVFIYDKIDVSDRFNVSSGLRLSKARVDLATTDTSTKVTIKNNDVSGSIGSRFSVNNNFNLIANLARGFRAPNIFDLGTLGARPGNRFNIANTELKPETVQTFELGTRFNFKNFDFEMMAWKSDYQDKITSVFTGDLTDSGRDIVQSQNASEVDLQGFELSGQWQMTENQSLDANINYTRGETSLLNGTRDAADRIPPLNGRMTWRYNKNAWTLNTELLFTDTQNRLSARDVRDPRINPHGTSGWGVLNIDVGYQFNESWSLNTRLVNLLDKNYREHGSGIDAAGRGIKVSLEFNR